MEKKNKTREYIVIFILRKNTVTELVRNTLTLREVCLSTLVISLCLNYNHS